VILPALGSGLRWGTNSLNSAGIISIITAPSAPLISTVQLVGDQFIFGGTNGPAQGPYYVLTSTNPALPLTNWTPIATNQSSPDGHFSTTNTVDPAYPEQFFMLQIP